MKVGVWVQAITVTMLPRVPVNSPIQVPPCAILCVEHRQSKLNRKGEGFTIISNRQKPSGFLRIFSRPASLRSLHLRNVNLQARMDYNGQVSDRPRTGREGCYSQPHRYIIFATTCAMDLSPTQPKKFISRPIPLGIKQPKREAVNLLPLVPTWGMLGSFYFTPPFVPTARCSFKRGWLPFEAKPCISNTVSA